MADRVCILSAGVKVAEATVAELRSSPAVRRVVCRTRAPLAEIENAAGVLSVRVEADGRLSVETEAPELLVQRLFSLDPNLAGLQVLHAGAIEAAAPSP